MLLLLLHGEGGVVALWRTVVALLHVRGWHVGEGAHHLLHVLQLL